MIKLLSYKYKIVGLFCVGCAIALTFVYFNYGWRISIPVFAIFSSYLETKVFATFKTNVIDEIILLLYVVGFFLISFTKEKDEKRCLKVVRRRALNKTIFAYLVWLLVTVSFVFGNAYIVTLILNLIIPFLFYLVFFYYLKNKELKRCRMHEIQKKILNR